MKKTKWTECVDVKAIEQNMQIYNEYAKGFKIALKKKGFVFDTNQVMDWLKELTVEERQVNLRLSDKDYQAMKMVHALKNLK